MIGLEQAADVPRERVYTALAPATVRAALAADPAASSTHLERFASELDRAAKRLAAAQRQASS
ncbi:hypothetical protein AQ490_12175 [Wenjunlia vitaminophila]|uniref:Uncharacterized protein n=1 Tax=Wenjunlia vitaminophila TaxID=76728 RepID=A0A0T6LKK3_WENVI|nr:hypothetical protein [Wenjunlia vitaminophila]KRV46621.1 hypothetical protein AQ490_12175 [Wenjunlia vitaminophila]